MDFSNAPLDVGLEAAADHVEEVNKKNGWYEDNRTFGDEIALLHSEVSEALEAYRKWGMADATFNGPESMKHDKEKPEGVGSELADVLIRLLDMTKRHGIDLYAEYVRKMAYNETRGYRHGGKKL